MGPPEWRCAGEYYKPCAGGSDPVYFRSEIACPEFRTLLSDGPDGYSRRSHMKVKFLTSAVDVKGYPAPLKPEVAIVGRSNAGKSSFINALTGQRIAKTSATPGKTRLLNFFELQDKLYMVDMPGYGWASGNLDEALGWRKMVEAYFRVRKTLKGVLLVMDIRRDWDEEEVLLQEWLEHHKIPYAVILNKADKFSRSQILNQKKKISEKTNARLFVLSSSKKTGFDEVKLVLEKEWS
jgi:GTP-binding protein